MTDDREHADWLTWMLVVVLPIVVGALAYPWAAVTTSARDCATGASGGGRAATVIGYGVLWLVAPVVVALRARRAGTSLAHAAAPVIVSALLAVPLIFLGAQVWWGANNCYT